MQNQTIVIIDIFPTAFGLKKILHDHGLTAEMVDIHLVPEHGGVAMPSPVGDVDVILLSNNIQAGYDRVRGLHSAYPGAVIMLVCHNNDPQANVPFMEAGIDYLITKPELWEIGAISIANSIRAILEVRANPKAALAAMEGGSDERVNPA